MRPVRVLFAVVAGLVLALGGASSLAAQAPTVTLGALECLPEEGNAALTARVDGLPGGATVRLYFRRMNIEVEDFYYVEMRPSGDGAFWAVFPQPTDDKATRKNWERGQKEVAWAQWWRTKEGSDDRDPNNDLNKDTIREKASLGKLEKRTWMERLDDKTFQDWLEKLEFEPAEYFVAVYDASGRLLAKSDRAVSPVTSKCRVQLTPQQKGYADNLTVGETAPWQQDKELFHWECDGVVTRINPQGILRADNSCRACVIAWWQNPKILVPALIIPVVCVAADCWERGEVSPSRP